MKYWLVWLLCAVFLLNFVQNMLISRKMAGIFYHIQQIEVFLKDGVCE